jgi:hypothetical protein
MEGLGFVPVEKYLILNVGFKVLGFCYRVPGSRFQDQATIVFALGFLLSAFSCIVFACGLRLAAYGLQLYLTTIIYLTNKDHPLLNKRRIALV